MSNYEAIFAVKYMAYSHDSGKGPVGVPTYIIVRRQFAAKNKTDAKKICRQRRSSIEDCFTTARTLSLSTDIGLEAQKYDRF
ncbi:MAG TPA: hypothetical protein ENI22_00510 [Candidatus Pacearchaeota archaeon]|nr:hypothetical protein [Candidatus Pacearchaeota archaeon]